MTTKRTAAFALVAGDRGLLTAAESLGLTVAAIREADALHALAHARYRARRQRYYAGYRAGTGAPRSLGQTASR